MFDQPDRSRGFRSGTFRPRRSFSEGCLALVFALLANLDLASCALAQNAEEELAGGILAIAGAAVITQTDLDAAIDRRFAELRLTSNYEPGILEPMRGQFAVDLLDEMIDQQLLLQEAGRKLGKRSIEEIIPDERVFQEIDARVESMRKEGHPYRTRQDYFDLEERDFGRSRGEVLRELRENMLVQHYLWEQILRRVDKFVSPRAARAFYRENLHEFTTPISVSFRQIRINADFQSHERVKAIKAQLAAGEDFVKVAARFGQNFEQNPQKRGMLWQKSFEELKEWGHPYPQIVSSMRKGEFNGPFRHRNQIFFIKLEDVVDGKPMTYAAALPVIEKRIRGERHKLQLERFLADLREDVGVEILDVALRTKIEERKRLGRDGSLHPQIDPGPRPETAPEAGGS